MTTGKALNGKPYAGNPHVRFDEGEVASAATPRRGSLLYSANHVNHVEWIDRCKGILIFLVVLGHVVGPNAHLTAAHVCGFYEAFYCVIYSFHMPAFFFLAGMTFKITDDSFFSFAFKKFKRLMVPYYVFGFLSLIIFIVAYSKFRGSICGVDAYYEKKAGLDWMWLCVGLFHGGQWPNGEGLRMNAALWFLPCLFSTEIVFYWLNRILPSRRIVKFGLIVACVVLVFVMVKNGCAYWPLGANKVPYYLIFLIAGNIVGVLKDWNMQGRKQLLSIVGCLLGIAIFTVVVGSMLDLSTKYYNSILYSIFLVTAFVGIGLCITFAQLIRIGFLRELGILSLGIMLIHKFFLLGVQFGMPWTRRLLAESSILTSLLITALVAILATWGAWVGSKVIMCFAPFLLGKSKGHSPKTI